MIVGLNNVNAKGITPMYISINNNLPCVDFHLGTGTCKTPCLRALVDSRAAMTSGNLDYHRTVMSRFPDIVAEYIECEPGTKYDMVQLKVAVTQSGAEEKFDDGTLSAIIRYKTPYFINSHCFILSFALKNSLSLRTILGTPSLEVMHGVIDLSDRTLTLKRLGITLPLVNRIHARAFLQQLMMLCRRVPSLHKASLLTILVVTWQRVTRPSFSRIQSIQISQSRNPSAL